MMMLRLESAALTSKGSWTLEDARQGDVYFKMGYTIARELLPISL